MCDEPLDSVFPHLKSVQVKRVFVEGGTVHVTPCTPEGRAVVCPDCGTSGRRVHSRHQRHLADTAVAGRPVVIDLSVRRLFCDQRDCSRCTFVEQVDGLTIRYRRRTLLHCLLLELALAPAGRTFDAVIAAQSWHWVDPVAGAAKAAHVLRPGGRLAIFGHVYEPPTELAEPFAAACRRAAPTPRSTANRTDVRSTSTRRHTRNSPARSARPNSSTIPNSGDSTGSSPTRATNGWTYYPPPVASPNSVPISWPRYRTRLGAPSTPWADVS